MSFMDEACSACPNDGREEHMNTIVHSAQATASQKRRARTAGVLYLIVAVFAAFAFNYATGTTYVPGDAAATAQQLMANGGLVRAGVVADLIQASAWIFTAMAFYLLLRHVNEDRARAMVILVAVGATIVCVKQVFPLAALLVVTENGYAATFGAAGSNALALLLLDISHYGTLVAADLHGPVAGAARASRLHFEAVPQGAGRRARGGRRRLDRGLAGRARGPRVRRGVQQGRHDAADHRRGLAAWLPACEGSEVSERARSQARHGPRSGDHHAVGGRPRKPALAVHHLHPRKGDALERGGADLDTLPARNPGHAWKCRVHRLRRLALLRPEVMELVLVHRRIRHGARRGDPGDQRLLLLSLVLFGLMNLLLAYGPGTSRYAALVVLGATCILWSARVLMQIAYPQGSMNAILQYGLLLAFTLVLACHAAALVLVILDRGHA